MDIKYKLYPHPVLISDTDDYVKSTFSFEIEVKRGIRELIFDFTMDLDNKEMLELIQDGEAEFLVHIECPQTCYRTVVKSEENRFKKSISEKELNGKVALCAFVVAKKDLTTYINSDFNADYEGISFSIDRGSIMAIGGQYDLNVVKDTEELAKIPSIFTICKYAADTDESMKIDIDGDKIAIVLSDNSFQNYKMLINMPSLLPVFHAMVIVPALIFTFETLRREGTEEYENRRWYMAIRKTLAKYEILLNNEILNDIPSYDLAQKLLDLPIDRALDAITRFDDSEEE